MSEIHHYIEIQIGKEYTQKTCPPLLQEMFVQRKAILVFLISIFLWAVKYHQWKKGGGGGGGEKWGGFLWAGGGFSPPRGGFFVFFFFFGGNGGG